MGGVVKPTADRSSGIGGPVLAHLGRAAYVTLLSALTLACRGEPPRKSVDAGAVARPPASVASAPSPSGVPPRAMPSASAAKTSERDAPPPRSDAGLGVRLGAAVSFGPARPVTATVS